MMRLSANLGFLWTDLPLPDRIAAAGRAGFRAAELHWPYDVPTGQVRQAAEAAGLRILALNSPRGDVSAGEFGMACLPGRGDEFLQSVHKALAYAREIGAGAVHVMAGKPGDLPAGAWRGELVANLRSASELAGDMVLLLEPLNRLDNPGYAFATLDEADEIRAATGCANIRLMLDAYHEAKAGLDPAEAWRRHRDVIGHVQIAGLPDRAEPAVDQPPLAPLLRALMADGYPGWIGCEYRPAAGTDAGLGWRSCLPG